MSAIRMRYLTIEQRESLRAGLERLIERLRGEIAHGPLPNHNEETDDEAIADLETSLEVAGLERAAAQVREAEAALERLHDPSYGVCAGCGADIPYVRLLAYPAATRCIACQRERERELAAPATAAARL
jgi:RNA polymerase-binding transcription factor DksA